MKMVTVNVEQEDVELLKKYDYETSAMKELISFFMSHNSFDETIIFSPIFTKYHDRYLSVCRERDEFKRHVEEKYVPDEFKYTIKTWTVHYKSCQIIIIVESEDE